MGRMKTQSITSTEKHGEAEMSNDTQSPVPLPPGWVRSGRDGELS
jgi:hypothetical protein